MILDIKIMKSKKAEEFIGLQESIYIDEIQFAIDDMKKAVELAEQELTEKAEKAFRINCHLYINGFCDNFKYLKLCGRANCDRIKNFINLLNA